MTMRRTCCSLVALAGLLATSVSVHAGPMTTGDRQRVLAHLEMSEAWLVSETEGLSKAQLTFRMTPDNWSIQDVVEHLAIAEPQYWQQVQARVPKGKYESVAQSLGDFRKLRATMTEFAKSTQEDLRGRQLQGGNMDIYQWLLMISTHSQRHILQIREVKAHASDPKN